VIIIDTLVIGGIKFILRRLAEAVDAHMNDVDALREELLLELGEITAEEFSAQEGALLARMREIRARTTGAPAGPVRITGIDVSVADDVDRASGGARER
jgi:hypothetical protein